MNKLAKHYYLAVGYYYLANDFTAAQQECYEVLDFSPQNKNINILFKLMKKNIIHTVFDAYRRDKLTQIMDNNDIDTYLMLMLSEYDLTIFSDYINWQYAEEHFVPNSPQHRIWTLILNKDIERAFSLGEALLLSIQGDPIVYFQLGYIYFQKKRFAEAEDYFFLLSKFGSLNSIVALNMLLKLSQHKFTTLAKEDIIHRYSLYLKDTSEIFIAGDILQKSWDNKAFLAYAKKISKNFISHHDYFVLAQLYINEGLWKNAVHCCYQVKNIELNDIQKITDLFLKDPPTSFPYAIKKFFSWLIAKSKDPEILLYLGKNLQKLLPSLALSCFNKTKKSHLEKSILGCAYSFYYLKKYSKALKFLHKLKMLEHFPQEVIHLESLIQVEKKPREILDFLLNLYAQNPQTVAPNSVLEIAKLICPVCESYQENSDICLKCGYQSSQNFVWQGNNLRWQSNKLAFPKIFLCVTTDCSLYDNESNIFIISFASKHCTTVLEIYKNGQKFAQDTFHLEGISIIEKKPFTPGMYTITLQTKDAISEHSFIVAKASCKIKFECVSQKWLDEMHLETVFSLTDAWGYAGIYEHIEMYDLMSNCSHYPETTTSKGKFISCKWRISHNVSSCVYIFFKLKENIVAICIKIRETNTWKTIENLPLKKLKKLNISYKIQEDILKLYFPNTVSQLNIIKQPLGIEPIEIQRCNDVERSIKIPLPPFMCGTYIGATRFAKNIFQAISIDSMFLLVRKPPKLKVILPEKIEPNTDLSILLEGKIKAKVFVFSRHKNFIFCALKDYLSEWIQHIHSVPNDNKKNWYTLPTNLISTKNYRDFKGSYEMDQHLEISLKSMPVEGIQKLTFIISDGNYFIEKTVALEVCKNEDIIFEMPQKIGKKSRIEVPIHLKTNISQNFIIKSQQQGVIEEGVCEGETTKTLVVYEPDHFTIVLGNKTIDATIDFLEEQKIIQSTISKVLSNNIDSQSKIYKNIFSLIQEISTNLLHNKKPSFEYAAAATYTLALLEKLTLNGDLQNNISHIEKQIKDYETILHEQIQPFIDNFWPYFLGGSPDRKISIEILNHLAIFAEIPKFTKMHHLMQTLLQKCLEQKVKDNRLLSLSLDFQEKISSPESAAGLILHNIDTNKSIKYLEKHLKKVNESVFWESKSLGGKEATTAYVAQALIKADHHLAENALLFLSDKWQNGLLTNTISSTTYIKTLLQLAKKKEKANFNWQKKDTEVSRSILENATHQKLSITITAPDIIKQGTEFVIKSKIKKIKYPQVFILIPAHLIVMDSTNKIYSGYNLWPISNYDIECKCKALFKGTGIFYILITDAYYPNEKIYDFVQITTL